MHCANRARVLGGVCLVVTMSLGSSASAQVDLSGEWEIQYHEDAPERGPGPDIGDYLGLPVNEAARLRADSWSASLLTVPEHQCKPHPADYGPSVSNLRIWKAVDTATQQLTAWRTRIEWMAPERTIWMDGRPHPPAHASHTWQGFSTGRWDGNMLTVTTTHLKAAHTRRNGVPRSDTATLTEHFIRHGNYLTWVSIIDDPVYLTERFIRTRNYAVNLGQRTGQPRPCDAVVEIGGRPRGYVPHHLPGTNPFLHEVASWYGVSYEATRGGADTMYPEYRLTMPPSSPPAYCERYCWCIGIQGVNCPLP